MLNFLAEERVRLGLKQKEVYEFVGLGKTQYIRWEKGNPIPSDKLLLLEDLGFDIYYVMTGRRDRKNKVDVKYYSDESITKGVKEFMFAARDMNWIDIPDEKTYNLMIDVLNYHIRKAAGDDVKVGEIQ